MSSSGKEKSGVIFVVQSSTLLYGLTSFPLFQPQLLIYKMKIESDAI